MRRLIADALDDETVGPCPTCGMPRDEWPDDRFGGFRSENGDAHCCKGCAEGTGCTCHGGFGINYRPPTARPRPIGAKRVR